MKNLMASLYLVILTACGFTVRDTDSYLDSQEIRSLNRGVVALVVPARIELESLGISDAFSTNNLNTLGRKHVSYCSGSLIGRRTVLTAAHCVDGSDFATESPVGDLIKIVSYRQGFGATNRMEQYRVYVVVKWDPGQDLALLRLQSGQLPHSRTTILPVGRVSPSFGKRVYAIGHPVGLSWSVTDGIVSNPMRLLRNRISNERVVLQKVIQASAELYFGNSGGPLLNTNGEVVGVASKMIEPHLAFSVHLKAIKDFIRGIRLL